MTLEVALDVLNDSDPSLQNRVNNPPPNSPWPTAAVA
jgi:hypothetical protein